MPMSPHSMFSAAADRLDRVIREVKERQFAATGHSGIPAPLPPLSNPEEAWMREYATHSFRPGRTGVPPPSTPQFTLGGAALGRLQRPRLRPEVEKRGEWAADNHGGVVPGPAGVPPGGGHIGAALGKPPRRRSLLARLFTRGG